MELLLKIMQKVVDNYGKDNKVAWVYRYMPLDGLHEKARTTNRGEA